MPLKKIHHTIRREHQNFWSAPKNQLERAKKEPAVKWLILVEILLAIVLAIGLFVYVSPTINIIPAPYNQYLFWLAIASLLTGLFTGIYLISHRHQIKKTAKEKFHLARKEPRIPALLFLEFFLAMVLVLATFIYLDASYNVIEWPFNVLFFLGVLGIVAYLYRYSKPFRKQYREFFNFK
ncbi:MAG: hypothetical protein V1777_02660 [Candidatus Micrarchaeota archaeon]